MLSEDELQVIESDIARLTWEEESMALGDITKRLLSEVRELQAQVPRWIPVSERLPETPRKRNGQPASERVFVLDTTGNQGVAVTDSQGNWTWFVGIENGEVVAWMPIPDDKQVFEP